MTAGLDFNDAPSSPAGAPRLKPDRELLAVYFKVVFGYLDGLFPFRGFVDQGQGHSGKPYNEWVDIGRDDSVNVIFNMANYCAGNGTAAYCIPGTVAERGQAKADDVLQTQVLVADIDAGNIAQKLAHAAQHLGTPTLIVESGGRTKDGQDKLHVYWQLTEPAEDEDLETVRRLRHELAVKIGADTHFQSMHQPIRIPGSVYHKHQRTRLVTIRAHNNLEYELADLAESFEAMPALAACGGPKLDFNDADRGARDMDELQSMLEKTKEPGHWHDNMRNVVASLVGKSWPDAQIKELCGPYCDGGGSDPELVALIISARKKW
ncbi:MAG: hypothetical protein V3R17_01735, partial [Hyphomicrobium sp.]